MATATYWQKKVCQSRWPKNRSDQGRPIRVADLFCGCGGMSLGALLAADELKRPLSIELAIDNWSPALDVYKENFGATIKKSVCGDVRSLPSNVGRPLDIVMAGPPCQGHSDLNNSTRRSDDRNELYMVPVQFAIENKSRFLLVENVPPVVHSSQRVVQRSTMELRDAGYSTAQLIVDVSNLGLPQKRRRHLLIASKDHPQSVLDSIVSGIQELSASPALMDFISDLEDAQGKGKMGAITKASAENIKRINFLFDKDVFDLPNSLRPSCHRDKQHSYGSMYGRMRPDRPSQTITSGFGSMGQGRFVHPRLRRTITAHEAARIQGFPDFFSFNHVTSLTSLRDMIANAVPPVLTSVLVSSLLNIPKRRRV